MNAHAPLAQFTERDAARLAALVEPAPLEPATPLTAWLLQDAATEATHAAGELFSLAALEADEGFQDLAALHFAAGRAFVDLADGYRQQAGGARD